MPYLVDIDPIAFSIGPVAVHWYGIMYLIAFAAFWWLGERRRRAGRLPVGPTAFSDLAFYGMIGVILGGRVGYMLCYATPELLADPLVVVAAFRRRIDQGRQKESVSNALGALKGGDPLLPENAFAPLVRFAGEQRQEVVATTDCFVQFVRPVLTAAQFFLVEPDITGPQLQKPIRNSPRGIGILAGVADENHGAFGG